MSESTEDAKQIVNANGVEAEEKNSEINLKEIDIKPEGEAIGAELSAAVAAEAAAINEAVKASEQPPAAAAATGGGGGGGGGQKCEFDVFISYNWDHKKQVRRLYDELTKKYGLKCWLDDVELKASALMDELAKGIQNSKVICCCITRKYCKSDNCIGEINYAKTIGKPMVILMFERLNMQALEGVGFIIGKLIRVNAYKFEAEGLFEEPTGELFNQVLKALRDKLDEETANTAGDTKGDAVDDNFVRSLNGHTSAVLCLQELTNNRLASASSDFSIIIWNLTDCSQLKKLEKHTDVVTCMKALPEAKLASGSMDTCIIIWSLTGYDALRVLKGHTEGITCLKLLPDKELCSGANDFTLRIWNLKTYDCTKEIRGHLKFYKKFFMSAKKGTENFVTRKILKVRHEPSTSSFANNNSTAEQNEDEMKEKTAENEANLTQNSNNPEKINDGDSQSTTDKQNILKLMKFKEHNIPEPVNNPKEDDAKDGPEELPEVEEDDDDVGYEDTDGKKKSSSKSVNRIDGHTKSIYCLKNIRAKDGVKESRTRFASGSGDKLIKVWDINSNYDIVGTLKGHLGQIICLKNLSKNRLASGSVDKTIRIWEMEKFTQLRILQGHTADIQCLQTIDSSKRLISGSCDTTIRIWNLSGKHECVKTVKEHTKYVNILKKVKTDRLISSANDNSIKVWDIRNFECIQTFKEHQKWVSHILMLQNGKVCSCSWDGSIKVWKPSANPV